jgi:hypothetical protein
MSSVESTWPEGTLARYLTVGGATVDITVDPGSEHAYAATGAVCLGCNATKGVDWVARPWDTSIIDYHTASDRDGTEYTATVRTWAQDHASTCRAIPKPGGAQ